MRKLGGLLAVGCIALTSVGAGCGDGDEERVDGQGYSYAVPDDWRDVSDEAQDEPELEFAGFRADTLVVGEREDGFTTNVNVVRESGLPAGVTASDYAELSIAALRDPMGAGLPPDLAEGIASLRAREFREPRDAELAEEDAVSLSYTGTQSGHELRFRQLTTVVGDAAYTVTLTAVPEQVEKGLAAFDEVVDSWQWD
jgi:hypothetical protein